MDAATVPCPVCGATMNHHADKLIYASDAEAGDVADRIAAFYRCPVCGAGETRTSAAQHLHAPGAKPES